VEALGVLAADADQLVALVSCLNPFSRDRHAEAVGQLGDGGDDGSGGGSATEGGGECLIDLDDVDGKVLQVAQ